MSLEKDGSERLIAPRNEVPLHASTIATRIAE
jgi:hypothetical protein